MNSEHHVDIVDLNLRKARALADLLMHATCGDDPISLDTLHSIGLQIYDATAAIQDAMSSVEAELPKAIPLRSV